MYIIKISDLSYKVILSQSDFGKYGNDIFDGGENSKIFFGDILDKVNQTYSERRKTAVIHADFFEDKFGGGELFLYFADNSCSTDNYVLSCSSFEDIITSAKIIKDFKKAFNSKLIFMKEQFFLILNPLQKESELPLSLYEMGKLTKANDLFIWHLEEHGCIIAQSDAIETIVSKFL